MKSIPLSTKIGHCSSWNVAGVALQKGSQRETHRFGVHQFEHIPIGCFQKIGGSLGSTRIVPKDSPAQAALSPASSPSCVTSHGRHSVVGAQQFPCDSLESAKRVLKERWGSLFHSFDHHMRHGNELGSGPSGRATLNETRQL